MRYVGFLSEGDMIVTYRNPVILYAEMRKQGYTILQHLYGNVDRLDTYKVRAGTGHWIYPHTKIFDSQEEAMTWVKEYWTDVLKSIDANKEKVKILINEI